MYCWSFMLGPSRTVRARAEGEQLGLGSELITGVRGCVLAIWRARVGGRGVVAAEPRSVEDEWRVNEPGSDVDGKFLMEFRIALW